MLGYVLDEVFVQHRAPSGHPERGARAEAVRDALTTAGIAARGRHIPVRAATDDELARVHGAAFLDDLVRRVPGNTGWLDPDTYFSPGTWDAARAAAGSAAALATMVLAGELASGLAVVRPPGHHATRDRAMGFCLLNNVAVAAAAARAAGAARVAIVDWDVHHGNGTQAIVWSDPSILYASTHEMPLYPGTGSPTETGVGNIVNVPLASGAGGTEFREAFETMILPSVKRFAPDLIVISAGFDAHWRDPLASLNLEEEDFAWATAELMDIANATARGRIVSLLEGGYDLQGLAGSVAAHVATLMTA
jgi:acetoin utilization deacetylase AcuC-like enzyme